MRVIKHPQPFLLLGADVLRGGRSAEQWNFEGMTVRTLAPGKVAAVLAFVVQGHRTEVPLHFAPAGEGQAALAHSAQLCQVGGPPIGGQYVRRDL